MSGITSLGTCYDDNPTMLDYVKKFHSKEMAAYNALLYTSVRSNDIDTVRTLLREKHVTAPALDRALAIAAHRGYNQIILMLCRTGVTSINEAIETAAERGNLTTVKTLESCGATIHGLLPYAATSGNMELMKYLIGRGERDFSQALVEAAKYNRVAVMKFLVELGADDFNAALLAAAAAGKLEAVAFLLDNGSNNYKEAIRVVENALDGPHHEDHLAILELLMLHTKL